MNVRRIALPALALAGLLAAACATLRVDVDVYKGPLADHEDIQAERMAVMAIGAKPLLIELRDRLEKKAREDTWPDLKQKERDLIGDRREFGPGQEGYKAKFIQVWDSPESYKRWSTLIDTKARRVNAVLWLYEDSLNPELAPYIADARRYYDGYMASSATLGSKAAERMHDTLAGLDKTSTGKEPSLARAYANFFQKDLCIFDLARIMPGTGEPGCGASHDEIKNLPGERSTLYFLNLAHDRDKFVTNHAKVLFKDSPADRENFVTLTKERAAAFLGKRRALEGLFSLSLFFLRDITEEPLRSTMKNQEQLVSIASDLAADILTAGYLTDLKKCCKQAPTCPDCKEIEGLTGKLSGSWKEVKATVKSLLRTQTHDTAVQLLAAHNMVKQGYCINPDPIAAQFGATLFRADKGVPTPTQLLDTLDKMSCLVSASGLDRGRGPWGLERLIEDYLKAAQDFTANGCGKVDAEHPAEACGEPAAKLRAKRDLLREELVRFAEKILVIANHEVLLTQYAENTGEPRAEIVDNIQVLQAVANSLLNQANELRFRQEHRATLANRLPGLKNTLEETYAPDGRRTLALVVQQLAAERAALAASLAKSAEAAKETEKELAKQKAAQEAKTNEATGLAAKRNAFKPAEDFKAALAAAAAQAKAMLGQGNALKALAVFKPYETLAPDKVAGMTGYTASVQAAGTYLATVTAELKNLNDTMQALGGTASSLQLAALQDEAQAVRDAYGAAQGVAKHAADLHALQGKVGAELAEPSALHKSAAACYALYVANQGWTESDTCKTFGDAPGLAKKLASLAGSQLLAALGDLQGSLSSNATVLDAAWSPAIATRLAELDKAEQAAKQEAATAGKKVEELAKASAAAAQPDASGKATLANLGAAIRTVDAIRATWLEKTPAESPQEVVSSLLKLLEAKAKDNQDCATTLGVIGARRFSFPTLGTLSPAMNNKQDPRLALDQLLDSLHLILAQEVKAGGAQSETAARTREAIAVVEAQRSGLIFLQPASAFLRSSYPATSVQPGYEPGWQNTLVNNFFRSFPLLGGQRSTRAARQLKVFAEIDRQSWQTVNTVRLEGVGNTNYAIAKDDIGNWYAKAYSTDPTDIIKGARSLAMFSLNMPPAAVSDTLAKAQAPTGDGTPAKQQTALEKLLGQHAARYDQNSKAEAEDLAGWLKSGNAASLIQDAWAADSLVEPFLDDLKPALPAAAKVEDLPAQAAKLPTDPAKADYGGFILAGLKAVKRYAAALDSKLASQPLSDAVRDAYATDKKVADTEKEAVTKEAFALAVSRARDTARTMLRNAIAQRLGHRQDTVNEYFRAASFIGQAAGVSTTTE